MLTIITINRNNAAGLEKTMQSVLSQTRKDFEYVVIDGASTDDSLAVIERMTTSFAGRLKWISEPDKGIYNAMNKGIGMATGKYVQFMNSGDTLVSSSVWDHIAQSLENEGYPPMLCGNRIKVFPDGHYVRDRFTAGKPVTFTQFYHSGLSHQATYIRRSLFEKYGLYDESLKIVSDWKWFMLVIGLKGEKIAYIDLDVANFDMTGVSQRELSLHLQERREVLRSMIPASILADYKTQDIEIDQIERLKRHPMTYRFVWFLERCLFKWEKWTKPRNNKQ